MPARQPWPLNKFAVEASALAANRHGLKEVVVRTTPTSAAPDAFGNQGARSSFALVLRGNLNRAKQCQPGNMG